MSAEPFIPRRIGSDSIRMSNTTDVRSVESLPSPLNRVSPQLARLARDSNHPYSLMAMAKLYGHLRAKPFVWQAMIYELMEAHHYTINQLSDEINVSARTIKRILDNQTQNPCINTSFRLFFLHTRKCPERYLQVGPEQLEMAQH